MDEPFVREALGGSRRWVLHPPTDPYGDGYIRTVRTEICDERVSAQTYATLSHPGDLAPFLPALADDWRGWSGVRVWRAREGEMGLDARHDGRGHDLWLALKSARMTYADDAWSARIAFTLEAGEEMTRLARDIRYHFGG